MTKLGAAARHTIPGLRHYQDQAATYGSVRQVADGEGFWRNVDVAKLPRHKFVQTGVGCKAHDDPTCLCDVKIPETPIPVTLSGELRYGTVAAKLLEIDEITPDVFHEFISVMLGMADHAAKLAANTGRNYVPNGKGNNHTGELTPWSSLDDETQSTMRECWKLKVKWSEAKQFLPETLTATDLKYIATYYNQRLYAKPKGKGKK